MAHDTPSRRPSQVKFRVCVVTNASEDAGSDAPVLIQVGGVAVPGSLPSWVRSLPPYCFHNEARAHPAADVWPSGAAFRRRRAAGERWPQSELGGEGGGASAATLW